MSMTAYRYSSVSFFLRSPLAQRAPARASGFVRERHTPVGRKGIRFLFRNPAAEPHTIRALVRVFVGVTQNDLETPSGDPGRVFFSV